MVGSKKMPTFGLEENNLYYWAQIST